ncbi:hypothetical protein [Xenorhabdus lircayensis]|uniref:Uncharacterized protein n=1 Tax=Xenorhabdus lircayensis TaxID=2763499 RepID=A0ABS0UCM8_9GAMM|nr:hypothetical protein [Xenorhabdus lircayensis]MBI6550703.1 hypothetical protein [Xenorhabdus lircayensis]
MTNTNRSVLSLKQDSKKIPIKARPQTNYTARRYERRAKFLAKKNQELELKAQERSVGEIWDSIFNPVDEIDVLSNLIVSLKKDIDNDNNGSCCMSEVALYSTQQRANRANRKLESGGVTARV